MSGVQVRHCDEPAPLSALTQSGFGAHRWLQAIRAVAQSLPPHVRLHYWKASLFQDEPYSDSFREFARLRGPPVAPLEAAPQLPGLPAGLEPGPLPDPADLRNMLREADAAALHPEVGPVGRLLMWPLLTPTFVYLKQGALLFPLQTVPWCAWWLARLGRNGVNCGACACQGILHFCRSRRRRRA
jgi:hypothetical protein